MTYVDECNKVHSCVGERKTNQKDPEMGEKHIFCDTCTIRKKRVINMDDLGGQIGFFEGTLGKKRDCLLMLCAYIN
jgi:hypothetical protein